MDVFSISKKTSRIIESYYKRKDRVRMWIFEEWPRTKGSIYKKKTKAYSCDKQILVMILKSLLYMSNFIFHQWCLQKGRLRKQCGFKKKKDWKLISCFFATTIHYEAKEECAELPMVWANGVCIFKGVKTTLLLNCINTVKKKVVYSSL